MNESDIFDMRQTVEEILLKVQAAFEELRDREYLQAELEKERKHSERLIKQVDCLAANNELLRKAPHTLREEIVKLKADNSVLEAVAETRVEEIKRLRQRLEKQQAKPDIISPVSWRAVAGRPVGWPEAVDIIERRINSLEKKVTHVTRGVAG